MAIKNFIMDELYSLSRSIDRVRTEHIDQTNFIRNAKKDLGRKFKRKYNYNNFARKFKHNHKFSS